MKTPYVPHTFGDAVEQKFRNRRGWLTAGVASSVTWPSSDVCVQYAGDEYFLRGYERAGEPSPPGITMACTEANQDEVIAKIYRFTSILSWFLGGYVDVSGYISSSHPSLYGNPRTVYSSLGIMGSKSFNCNHMPIIECEHIRRALAFWREGKKLVGLHPGYAFLSFYKVIESQFSSGKRKGEWISSNIGRLTDRAAKRVAELREAGTDVSRHLFESGRCAVAHASLEGEIVDPDIPADRRRLAADLVIIEELARIYIRDELKVPDSRSLYRARDRLTSLNSLISMQTLEMLKAGEALESISELDGQHLSVGLWPDGPIPGLERMTMHVDTVEGGVAKVDLVNKRKTILIVLFFDFQCGRAYHNLEDGGLIYSNLPDETDVRAYATYFYKVLGNGIAELTFGDTEPIDCEVVFPVNIIPPNPDEAIAEVVEIFRRQSTESDAP